MMCKKTSSRWSAAKLLLVLPLVAVSLAATATTVYVPKEQNKGNENFAIEQEPENSTIRISDEKIYLNSEEIPFDELKERVQDFRQINLVADKGTTMGEVADVRSELRENPELKVNYLANDTVKINSTQHLTVKSEKSVPVEDLKKGDTIEMKSVTGESIWVRYIGDGSSALVLIDGKERNLDEISVDDIESFTVLKDEKATMIYGEKGKNGVILITTKQAAQQAQATEDTAFIKVESMPTFQGGDLNGYRNWFQSQLQYPAEAKDKGIKGRVIFSFVVEKDGSVSEFKVLNTPDKIFSAEVERVFKLTPKWEPGKQNGNAVRVKFTVPIYFKLEDAATATTVQLEVGSKAKAHFDIGLSFIKQADALQEKIDLKAYGSNTEFRSLQKEITDKYLDAVPELEKAYELAPNYKPIVETLKLLTFRLRDENGMMAKYEKYKKAFDLVN